MTMTLPSAQTSLPEGVEMPLTPDEIANKSFPSVLRGYAKWEVDEFLKDVALDYQRALGLAEWAMQRSALLVPDTVQSEHLHDAVVDRPTSVTVNVSTALPPPPPASAGASTGQSVAQIEKIGEHIRYLAVLVNNLNQRIDVLESPRPQVAESQVSPMQVRSTPQPVASLANGVYPSGFAAAGATPSTPSPIDTVEQTRLSPSDWWPTESPLWVVNKSNGSTPPARNYPPA
jgi:DivIVA domain-containing protein